MSAVADTIEKKVHVISLGCPRNRVDSEVMLGSLMIEGWAHIETPEEADVIIVNTCGFIQSAKEESIDTILRCAAYKDQNPDMRLVVTGCLTQRYKSRLVQGLPEVDLFIGTDEFSRIAELLEAPPAKEKLFAKRTHYLYNEELPRVNTLTPHSAYVKIAEGCQHNCAFCSIPAIRGRLRSRPIDNVVAEVKGLVANGVKEVILIAQDIAAYGRDHSRDDLLPLLQALEEVEGLQWLRLLYMYPENISETFLDFFASSKKLVPYLDIPVQHASNTILASMKRCVDRETLTHILKRVRTRLPALALRTTVMVGFPGETEADFAELLDFVQEMEFDHLGCFAYSQEEGTVAGRMENQIEEDVKKDRLHRLMALQQGISERVLQRRYADQRCDVLLEKWDPSSKTWQGRLSTQAPQIDGIVDVHGAPETAVVGTIGQIQITGCSTYDLQGEWIES